MGVKQPEKTKVKLARALKEAGLTSMARNAIDGLYGRKVIDAKSYRAGGEDALEAMKVGLKEYDGWHRLIDIAEVDQTIRIRLGIGGAT